MIFVVKRDGTVLRASHPDYGAPGSDEVDRSILEFFAKEHSADIVRSFENVFSSREPRSFMCRGNHPLVDGAWYDCRVSPNHGESDVESATVVARNITECKHSEDRFEAEMDALKLQIAGLSTENEKLTDRLSAQEQSDEELSRFRAIMNHAGEAIFITDPNTGRFVDVNETACRWLGVSRDRLLQKGVNDLDLDFPLESSDGIIDHVVDTRDVNRPISLVRGSHPRRNGTSFPVEVTLSKRRFGDRDFLLVVARDVQQRQSTEHTSLDGKDEPCDLLAVSRDAVYSSARDGTVSAVNDSALDLFGYTRSEFLGLEARILYRHPECIPAFQRAVDENGSVKNFRAEFQTKAGQSFQGFLGATLRYDAHGDVQGYQCIVSPVSDTASPDSQDAVEDSPPEACGADNAQDEPGNGIRLRDPSAREKEAARPKRELEEARLEAAKAWAFAEKAMSQAANARVDADGAQERADAWEAVAERSKRKLEETGTEAAKARIAAEHALTEVAKTKLDAAEAKRRTDALEREAERAKTEIEEAKSEAAKAWAFAEKAMSQAANARVDAEGAQERADAGEEEAEQAKGELEEAKSGAAKAWAFAEKAMSQAANAMLDAESAQERADAGEKETEQAKGELEEARSEAARARANAAKARIAAEHALTEVAKAKLDAAEAKKRADALEREAERAKRETEKAKSEAAKALADVEKTMSQAANARLDAQDAKQRALVLEREAERAKREIEEGKSEAAKAWAFAEKAMSQAANARLDAEGAQGRADAWQEEAVQAKREVEEARSEAAGARADAKERRTRHGTRVHLKRLSTVRAASLAANAKTRVEEAPKRAARTEAEGAQPRIWTANLGALIAESGAERARSNSTTATPDVGETKE